MKNEIKKPKLSTNSRTLQKSIIVCASPTYGDFIPKAQDLFPLLWNFSSKGADSCNVLELVDNFGS